MLKTPLLQKAGLKSSSDNPVAGNRSLSALAGWQPTDDRQEYQLTIKGSVARNLEPLEVGLQILQQNITDLNKTRSTGTSLCFRITGLDSPILLETPPIDLHDIYIYLYYDVYYYIRDQLQYKDLPYSLRHHIENIYWKFYYLYWKIKYEIVEMLSGKLLAQVYFPFTVSLQV